MQGCVITRDHLERIWELAREGFPADSTIIVETDRSAYGISSTISSGTISATIAGVRQANLAGDPNYIDNISLRVSAPIPESVQSRSVSIRIDQDYTRVSVKGEDAGWVRGRIGGLRDMLASKRTKLHLLGEGAIFKVSIIALVIGGIIGTWAEFYSFGHFQAFSIYPLLIPVGIVLVMTGGGAILGSWIGKRARTRLILIPGDSPPRKVDKISLGILIVAIAGAFIAILAILIAHNDATHAHAFSPYRNPVCTSSCT